MKQIMTAAIVSTALIWPALAPTTAKAQQITGLDNPEIAIEYAPPSSSLKALYQRLTKRKVLEQIKQFLAPLQLGPVKKDGRLLNDVLLLKIRECTAKDAAGIHNAWYSDGETSITYCLQYIQQAEQFAPKVTTAEGLTRDDAIDGDFLGTMFHELGHAVIDLFEIPVFGREEDAADQISAFILLQFGPNAARRTILAKAHNYQESNRKDPSNNLSDVHATNLQRFYNYLCMGYGGYPEAFKDLIDKPLMGDKAEQKFLPTRRAANCKNEYEQVRLAFATLLKPHLDLTLVDRVKATIACIPANGRWALNVKC